jgi:hypothetical protein
MRGAAPSRGSRPSRFAHRCQEIDTCSAPGAEVRLSATEYTCSACLPCVSSEPGKLSEITTIHTPAGELPPRNTIASRSQKYNGTPTNIAARLLQTRHSNTPNRVRRTPTRPRKVANVFRWVDIGTGWIISTVMIGTTLAIAPRSGGPMLTPLKHREEPGLRGCPLR